MDKQFSSGLGRVFIIVGTAVVIYILILTCPAGNGKKPAVEPVRAMVPAVATKVVTIDNPLVPEKDARISDLEKEVFQIKDDLRRLRERVGSLEDFRSEQKETPEK